jgi:lysophospholipase L1-like esterase
MKKSLHYGRSCARISCMRKGRVGGVALVTVALSLSACYSGNSAGPKVAVNGDSITGVAVWTINDTLAPDYYVDVQGQNGFTIGQSLPELQTLLTDPQGAPNDVILETGTNDVMQQNHLWWAELDQEVSMVANTPCVVFVNVSTYADFFGDLDGLPPMVPDINAAIAQEVATHPNFHLLDWNAFINQPGNFDTYIAQGPSGLVVHPNAAGQQALANLEQQALQQDCGT